MTRFLIILFMFAGLSPHACLAQNEKVPLSNIALNFEIVQPLGQWQKKSNLEDGFARTGYGYSGEMSIFRGKRWGVFALLGYTINGISDLQYCVAAPAAYEDFSYRFSDTVFNREWRASQLMIGPVFPIAQLPNKGELTGALGIGVMAVSPPELFYQYEINNNGEDQTLKYHRYYYGDGDFNWLFYPKLTLLQPVTSNLAIRLGAGYFFSNQIYNMYFTRRNVNTGETVNLQNRWRIPLHGLSLSAGLCITGQMDKVKRRKATSR